MSFTNKILLILYFLIVFLFTGTEVIEEIIEFGTEESIWHSIGEIVILVVSLIGLVYLLLLIVKQVREKKGVDNQLKQANQKLESFNIRLQNVKKEFSNVIQLQFKEWQLTSSEQEVAHLLLKGLSFKEIAEIRETKEKPCVIKQQGFIPNLGFVDAMNLLLGFLKICYNCTQTHQPELVVV